MISFDYNGITREFVDNEALPLLNVYEFIRMFEYDVDKLYIDRFWDSIDKNDWVNVDKDTLRWIGYSHSRDRDNKRKYLDLLSSNFVEGKDFNQTSGDNFDGCVLKDAAIWVIRVRAKAFKKSLLMLRTQRAGEIREYYLLIEEIFMDYSKYTLSVNDHNHTIEINHYKSRLEETESVKNAMHDDTPIRYCEYTYILTTAKYYSFNLFKIGKTKDLSGRLSSYNTGVAMDSDKCFYIYSIKTSDSKALENQLHKMLKNFHHGKEWFRIHPKDLCRLVKFVNYQQDQLLRAVNKMISSPSQNSDLISLEEFTQLSGDSTNLIMNVPVAMTEDVPVAMTEDVPVAMAGGVPEYSCKSCRREYKIKKHYDKHLAKGCIKCPKCSKVCPTRNALIAHQSRQRECVPSPTPLPITQNSIRCSGCSKGYATQSMLNKHVAEGCSRCTKCSAVFDTRRGLTRHLARKSPCV